MGPNTSAHRYRHKHFHSDTRTALRRYAALAGMTVCALVPLARLASAAVAPERLALHQFEDGPVLPPNHTFLPGETVYFSCRVMGFQLASGPDEQRFVKLSWHLETHDPAGIPLEKPASGRIEQQVFTQDKNWLPKFLHSFAVPPYAIGGTYRISVSVKDEVSGSEFATRLEFPVRGRPVEPSDVLTGRNLHFLRTEQDGPPLDPAVFHPGETMWARFDITGYKFGANNRYSVEYGLAVLKESGEQVFAQPGAASDSEESFYPQRYVPGALSLNLNPDVPLGNYVLVVTMEDKIGGQRAEVRGDFRIEK
jgi:hypothetical protein